MDFSCKYFGFTYINDNLYNATCIIIAICILVLLIPTFTINLAIIVVFIKKTVLHTPAFFIIVNMAVADLLASCTSYLMLPIALTYMLLGRDPCSFVIVSNPLAYIFCFTSFLSIVLQSVERYLAIFYPFWYHDRLTNRMVVYAIIACWVMASGFTSILLITKDYQLFSAVTGTCMLVLFLGTLVIYFRIFKEVRRIEKQPVLQSVADASNDANVTLESKVAKATVIILSTFVLCFAPGVGLTFITAVIGGTTYLTDVLLYWVWLLALLNSFFNPLVICRQLSALRKPVTDMIFFWKFNRRISPQGTS